MLGKPGDMAIGLSTSGKSANVNRTLQLAREMGMMTIGFAGRDGGRMPPNCDYCFMYPQFLHSQNSRNTSSFYCMLYGISYILSEAKRM